MIIDTEKAIRWRDPKGKQYVLQMQQDPDPIDPREFDDPSCRFSHMYCWHKRYNIGDQNPWPSFEKLLENLAETYDIDPEKSQTEILEELKPNVCLLPIWAYEHSGITITAKDRVYPYNDRFDSGCIGCIYTAKHEFNALHVNNETIIKPDEWYENAKTCLQQEVETYDQYLCNEVYDYALYEENEHGGYDEIETCGNFFGSDMEKSGIMESVGHGLKQAIEADTYELIDPLTEEEILGQGPMTLKDLQDLMARYDIILRATPYTAKEHAGKILVTTQKDKKAPICFPSGPYYETIEEAINAIIKKIQKKQKEQPV